MYNVYFVMYSRRLSETHCLSGVNILFSYCLDCLELGQMTISFDQGCGNTSWSKASVQYEARLLQQQVSKIYILPKYLNLEFNIFSNNYDR